MGAWWYAVLCERRWLARRRIVGRCLCMRWKRTLLVYMERSIVGHWRGVISIWDARRLCVILRLWLSFRRRIFALSRRGNGIVGYRRIMIDVRDHGRLRGILGLLLPGGGSILALGHLGNGSVGYRCVMTSVLRDCGLWIAIWQA